MTKTFILFIIFHFYKLLLDICKNHRKNLKYTKRSMEIINIVNEDPEEKITLQQ